MFLAYLQWCKVLLKEGFVFVVAVACAQHLQVVLTDDDAAASLQLVSHFLGAVQLACILQCLIIAQEACHHHAVDAIVLVDVQVEVAHQEVGEVVFGKFKQHLMCVDRVGLVCQHKDEACVALNGESIGTYRVGGGTLCASSAPHIAKVKASAVESASLLHTLDNHTRQFAHLTLWIFLYHRLQFVDTLFGIAFVEQCKSLHQQELVAVGTQGESLFRNGAVAFHLIVSSFVERLVGGGIHRVFDMLAKPLVFHEERVGEQFGPVALGIFLLHTCQASVGNVHLAHACIEQVEVVPCHIVFLKVGIVVSKSEQ